MKQQDTRKETTKYQNTNVLSLTKQEYEIPKRNVLSSTRSQNVKIGKRDNNGDDAGRNNKTRERSFPGRNNKTRERRRLQNTKTKRALLDKTTKRDDPRDNEIGKRDNNRDDDKPKIDNLRRIVSSRKSV